MATSIKSTIKKIVSSQTFKATARTGFFLAPLLIPIAIYVYCKEDFGYDTARDLLNVITALSSVFSPIIGLKIAFSGDDSNSAINIAKGLGVALGIPIIVHLVGTFYINCFGGLGG